MLIVNIFITRKIEFKKIAQSCALGFAIMGGIGYVVKLLFIPINNIILS
jgi:protein transport protein SEC61 subunit gamma-like protein